MNRDYLDDLPIEIQKIFKELTNIFNINEIESVILVGSASRGELSFFNENELFVRSDIEFYVITDKIKKVKESVSSKIKNIELKYNKKWPEFHIDIAYLNKSKFTKLKPWIRHYELIKNGKILIGKNLISSIPEVKISNLDYNELNEVALWKMLSLLSRFPAELLKPTGKISLEYGFSLARNILDVTTWVLPGEGILIPNYHDRVLFWKNKLDKKTKKHFLFINDSLLEECIRCRRNNTLDLDLNLLLNGTVETWLFIYDIVKGNKSINHLGEGKGFRKINSLKILRGLYRNKEMDSLFKYNMIKFGPFNLFAEISVNLLKCIINWDQRKKFLKDNQKLITIKHLNSDIDSWIITRRILMKAIDNYLGSNQWSRFINKKDKL